jgi:mRNA interferase HigB
MRIIAAKTLKLYWEAYPLAKQPLLAWYEEVEKSTWSSPNELKEQYRNASVLSSKRIVFNIHGNAFRLIVDIEFRLRLVFIVWFGSHKEYDEIDAKTIYYDNSGKK